MKSLLCLCLALLSVFNCMNVVVDAFQVSKSPVTAHALISSSTMTTTSLNVFGNKKSKKPTAEEILLTEKYWGGDWVCKDCGYIYNRVRMLIK